MINEMRKLIYILTFVLLCLLAPKLVCAQRLETLSLTERIRYFIKLNYKPNQSALSDSCINSIIIVKFKVVHQQIDSLDFSANSNALIKEALLKAISTTNKQLKLSKADI